MLEADCTCDQMAHPCDVHDCTGGEPDPVDRTAHQGAPAPAPADSGEISDGYHTFRELYAHRAALWAVLAAYVPGAWKSRQHDVGSDTPMPDGYFVVGANLFGAGPVTYHLPIRYWEACPGRVLDHALAYDGHTSNDVVYRLWGHVAETGRARGRQG